ncbi:MAG: hypothetical protein UR21_C0003G0045 [Candidatus Woesebacteria bacterium GW2011_GWC2_31_9]|uniref:Uncharacterized protein n=1 Tax=Candidatus Woesebacteria bacterium GW2011_GWC2_31_9 TaxID=1618586 RepID=A0A0G0BLS8_9BACT|nr:MAG: hypothetical protein UR21_C0003G0045 [Candidatus Woesebacteria bacterium GW2011_GWC2_31_9]
MVSLVKQTHRLDEWKNHLPPARSDYKDSVDYQKAYEKWRGKACFKIPIPSLIPFIGGKEILLCGENPLSPNYYSSLYSYIPLSSTEDLEGNIKVDALSSATGSGVTNIKFNNQSPATLFFPHIQESDQLGSILQNTYISNEQINEKVGANTAVESPTSCTTVDVRSNNGDSLFATSITGNLEYAASFTCDFDPPVCVGNPSTRYAPQCTKELQGKCVPPDWSCDLKFSQQDCPTGYICGQGCFCEEPVQTCKKSIYISLSTTSNTPIIDDVWSRLVAGPTAVVKRLFPKLGDQIGTLKDLPGSTDISYTGAESSSATLNLPHVGGISEYFLKGIQTLLRPKGYGEPISFGETEIGNCDQTTLPNIPDATEQSCKVCGYSLSPTFKKIIESAGQTFGVPGSVILGTIYHEGAFSRGIDWSEENVIKWSLCGGEVPGCDKNATSVAQIPFGWIPYYFYGDDSLWSAVQKIDSTRTKATISPCNVLDGIYATAKALSVWSGGLSTSVKYPTHLDPTQAYSQFPDTCYNWNLNNGTGAVMSCDLWNENTVATSQVGYAGYCPEPGKHPIGQVFPDNAPFIQQTVGYFNSNTCK